LPNKALKNTVKLYIYIYIYIILFFFLHEHFLFKKSKIIWHVSKKKILHGFYNRFIKFQMILAYVACHLRGIGWWFFVCILLWLVRWSRHLVFNWRLLGNPGAGLVRDSRVRDWLWLGKVLAPLTHPTWGKLLRGLDVLKKF